MFNSDTVLRPRYRWLLNFLIKVLILLWLAWAFQRQIFSREDLTDIYQNFITQLRTARLGWLVLVWLLLPVNWGLEAAKWRRLMSKTVRMDFRQALKGVLSGVTLSVFTPNRVGEYGGRLLQVEARYNWQAVIATLVGSLSQQVVLLGGGLIGAALLAGDQLAASSFLYGSFLSMGIGLTLLLTLLFFNLELVLPLVRRLPWGEKLYRHLEVLRHYDRKVLGAVLLLSFLRYLTYSGQYYFMLRFFGIDPPAEAAFAGIATIFLIQTSIPLPPLLGLLARGEVALLVWASFSDNPVSILAATFALFIINLSLPALLGAVVIVKTNILKSLGYEKNDG